ncbi:hypothetical protein TNCV_1921031 [Trichonephila clavipes]|nr:hypothetical protein TNCV_1921031 [Trichonephila clavipes]
MLDVHSTFRQYHQYERRKSFLNDNTFIQQNVQVNDDNFAAECLRSHNHYRAQHGASPLHLSVSVSHYFLFPQSDEWNYSRASI